jgi:hypothetical protein
MITDSDKLKLILLLCKICRDQDSIMLSQYMHIVSRKVETDEFNRILRRSMKIMGDRSYNSQTCQDWLMNELFTLYKLGES